MTGPLRSDLGTDRRHLVSSLSGGPVVSRLYPTPSSTQATKSVIALNEVLHVIEQDAESVVNNTTTAVDMIDLFNPRPMNPNKRIRVVKSLTIEESLAQSFKEQPDNVALVRQVFRQPANTGMPGVITYSQEVRDDSMRSQCKNLFHTPKTASSALISPVSSKSNLVGNKRKVIALDEDFLEFELSFSSALDGHDDLTGGFIPDVLDLTPPQPTLISPASSISGSDTVSYKLAQDKATLKEKETVSGEEYEPEGENEMIDWDSAFRPYQSEQWYDKYEELCQFHQKHGHCGVPPSDAVLYRWLKRQRHQYRLKQEGKASPISDERIAALDKVGISWDPQGDLWTERLTELRDYCRVNGHCNVPSRYPPNAPLSTWVKCQRRQYKLFKEGKSSNITQDRIEKLKEIGFVFVPRAK